VREVVVAMLDDLGYSVIEAGIGAAALDILRGEENIDLLLADYTMPGMNGAEVVRGSDAAAPAIAGAIHDGLCGPEVAARRR
jgi:CheY-like chemotaxis protein